MSKHYSMKDRSLEEAVAALWQVIDEAEKILMDPKTEPVDKKSWAKILGDTIAVLNKVLQSQNQANKSRKMI